MLIRPRSSPYTLVVPAKLQDLRPPPSFTKSSIVSSLCTCSRFNYPFSLAGHVPPPPPHPHPKHPPPCQPFFFSRLHIMQKACPSRVLKANVLRSIRFRSIPGFIHSCIEVLHDGTGRSPRSRSTPKRSHQFLFFGMRQKFKVKVKVLHGSNFSVTKRSPGVFLRCPGFLKLTASQVQPSFLIFLEIF